MTTVIKIIIIITKNNTSNTCGFTQPPQPASLPAPRLKHLITDLFCFKLQGFDHSIALNPAFNLIYIQSYSNLQFLFSNFKKIKKTPYTKSRLSNFDN